ncbi:hypothetical protein N878_26060 [Pseudomonas sp. EGD-AK9]|nr:hypothetical protein N878_26060 [Pseudomonas sp. EGD-AK9]
MHADRIDIFHIADGNACVIAVTHDFIFNFFKAGNAFFDKALIDRAC